MSPLLVNYAPSTLVGVTVLLILIGRLVPWSVVKQKDAENEVLRATNAKLADALAEHNKTAEIIQRLFGDLDERAK